MDLEWLKTVGTAICILTFILISATRKGNIKGVWELHLILLKIVIDHDGKVSIKLATGLQLGPLSYTLKLEPNIPKSLFVGILSIVILVVVALVFGNMSSVISQAVSSFSNSNSTPTIVPSKIAVTASAVIAVATLAPNLDGLPYRFSTGEVVTVYVENSIGLALRNRATRAGQKIRDLTNGTKVTIVDGPVRSPSLGWWKVRTFQGIDVCSLRLTIGLR